MATKKRGSLNWAPISGQWKIKAKKIEYLGPDDPNTPVGVAISTARVRNGQISVRICLNNSDQNSGRILLGYHTVTGAYYSVGLAGYGYAYVIDEFIPGQGWRSVISKGSKKQLEAKRNYEMQVGIHGQSVSLNIDGIRIMDYTLPSPLGGGQAGLFAWGPGPVSFENFDWSGDIARSFIVMPLSPPFNDLYKEVIIPVCEKIGILAFRADDVFKPGIIMQDIIQALVESDIIIAEISSENPNVYYEIGYAHALGKPTILLAKKDSELPFDISGYRVIFYDNSIGGKPEVEKNLEKHLNNILIGRSR